MQLHWTSQVRKLMGWVALLVGGLFGWGLVELAWRLVDRRIHGWDRPERGWGYLLIALACSLSLGVVGLAVVRIQDLPDGGSDGSQSS